MVQINFARKEINCKIVYYGPGMSGKTTNLEIIHRKTPDENKGELTCIATEGDRTLFFDFMPLNLGNIMGMNTKFQLYTVPGQVYYNSTRKLVLRGADGVIFVADSAPDKMDENLESLHNLEENFREYGRDVHDVPVVIQYNKRDLPNALPLAELEQKLNPRKAPSFEAVAKSGDGVFSTLKALAGLVIENLNRTARKEVRPKPAESPDPVRTSATRNSESETAPAVGTPPSRIPIGNGSGRRQVALAATSKPDKQALVAETRGGVGRARAVASSGPVGMRPSLRAEVPAGARSLRPKVPARKAGSLPASRHAPKHAVTVLLLVLGIVAAAAAVFFVSRG